MAGKPDTGTLEFEKVSLTDARKALEETGPAAYATPKKTEDWEAKRKKAARSEAQHCAYRAPQ